MTETVLNPVTSLSESERARLANAMMRRDFRAFCIRALLFLIPDVTMNWHHFAMMAVADDILQGQTRRAMINLSPRTLKSQIFSVVLPAYILGINPKAKIICVSYGRDLADGLSNGTRQIMESGWYKRVFPKTELSQRAAGRLRTTLGGTRMATSIDGGVTGLGGDYIIVDDPLQADDAESDAVRNSVNDWLASSLFSRLDDPRHGAMIMVAQRLHQDDPIGRFQSLSSAWTVLSIPVIADDRVVYDLGFGARHVSRPGDYMDERRLGRAELEALRDTLGERRFDAQYLQRPVPADGAYFKRKWIVFDQAATMSMPGDVVIQSWDVASKTGEANDYSVCITAIQRRSQVIVVDVLRKKLAFPELQKAVVAQALAFRPRKLLIEDASAGQQLIQMLRAEQPRHVPMPIAIKPIQSKLDRAIIAATRAERGELVLPERAPWLETLTSELMGFPMTRHDDQVDALAHLMTYTDQVREFGPIDVDGATAPSHFLTFGGEVEFDDDYSDDEFDLERLG